MKILLCNPNTDKPVYNQAGRLPPLVGTHPPLGIGYLAASLAQDSHDVALYDFAGAGDYEIESAIRAESPEVVGVTCFTLSRGAAIDVTQIAKKVNPSIHTVMGGSHATALPDQILRNFPSVDSIVLGEGELILRKWAARIAEKKPIREPVGGVAYRSGTEIKIETKAPFVENIDCLPFPVRKLRNNPPYSPYPEKYKLGEQAAMIASRGCPYRCQFCSTSVFWGGRYRIRSAANVVDEIEGLVAGEGKKDVEILDDALTVKKDWVKELCAEIQRRRLRFDWTATTRANYVDFEMFKAMRKAGCQRAILGIESFSNKILKGIGKKITREQAMNAITVVKKAGLQANCLLMVGNPGETWETVNETIEAIRACRPDTVTVNPLQVYPETEIYEIAKRGGLLDDSFWLDTSRAAPIFTLENSVEQLMKYVEAIHDAQWSSRWYVKLHRKSGLRGLRRWAAGKSRRPTKS